MVKITNKVFQRAFAFLVLFSICFLTEVRSQCSGGNATGAIAPNAGWQIKCIKGGDYKTFTPTLGQTYVFSFCQGGGTVAAWPSGDSQLTIIDNSTGVVYAFNDDFCGYASEITWVASVSTTCRVLVNEYNCAVNATCVTLAYKKIAPVNDNICTATYIYGNGCSCQYVNGTNVGATNSAQANPGCATYNGNDVWFATKVTSSGKMLFTGAAGTITNAGMAVYKATSCVGALTMLGCNNNSGPGGMPQLNLSGLTPGDSLFIRFWSFNNLQSGTFGLCIYDLAPYYCMAGNASELIPGSCLQLTPNKGGQQSAVWNTTQINMSNPFDYTFTTNFGNSDAGADGMTFTLQNSPAGTAAVGISGFGLGASGITNSLITEFDTYDNGVGVGDIPDDHIAIDLNGNLFAPVVAAVPAAGAGVNIEDGLTHTIRVTWNPASTTYTIYFDGVVRVTYVNDLITNVFGGNPMVDWGFTSSTGLFSNSQSICPGTLPGTPLPVTWSSYDASLFDHSVYLSWATSSEQNSKFFIIERSIDGINFASLDTMAAKGQSQITSTYDFVDNNPFIGIVSYYRIKQIDINGSFNYSSTKEIDNSHIASFLTYKIYPNPASSKSEIEIEVSKDATMELYDNMGVLIIKLSLEKGLNAINLSKVGVNVGVYHCILKTEDVSEALSLIITE